MTFSLVSNMQSYSQDKLVSQFWDTLYNPILRGYTYCGFMHKRLPLGYTRAKTEHLKKFHFAFSAKKCVIHEGGYKRGDYNEALLARRNIMQL